jgi:hypothetical protein
MISIAANSLVDEKVIATALWQLVDRYVGKVAYKGAVKADGLALDPPVIDCSGWAALLITSAMKALDDASPGEMFGAAQCAAVCTWSDRMIEVIESRTGCVLEGNEITPDKLPRFALIGLRQGGGAWAANHPRPRGITHVVQIVRDPRDGTVFVTESQGWAKPHGLRLLPLEKWIELSRSWLKAGEAWAVDPFAPTRQR